MKFTLFAFHVYHAELHEPGMPGDLTEFAQLLAETATHRVDICQGVYVFETQTGWRDMHRLRARLVQLKREYAELPFEGSIAGFFSSDVANRLREIGKSSGQEISLLNLNPE